MLEPYLADRWRLAELTVNYRTPAEVMRPATAMLAAAGIGTAPITSARSLDSALAEERVAGSLPDRLAELATELLAAGGQLAVITAAVEHLRGRLPDSDRLALLSPAQAKGLEFDRVLLVEPADIVGASRRGPSDLYVAMTRATQQLYVVHAKDLPPVLESALSESRSAVSD